MKISQQWLNDFVPCTDLTSEAFVELLTTKVAEVDSVEEAAGPVNGAVVSRIKSVQKHPSKDKLTVAEVEIGASSVTVVCGAPRCEVGMWVAYVPPGAKVYPAPGSPGGESGTKLVEKREVAGVESCGVLVSEAELGLSGDHSGLLELSSEFSAPELRTGRPLAELVGGSDLVVEIDNKSLTHRPDLWSHFGFAREVSAILGRALTNNIDRFADVDTEGKTLLSQICGEVSSASKGRFQVDVSDGSACRRFTALEFSGVKAIPSPLWMRRRLYSVGAGIRNQLVDLSNYVMLDIGQPNHAYDADLLHGTKLTARLAKDGEKFVGLDGVERELTTDDVVIADNDRAVALAGVIGGAEASINDQTKTLLLESANFDPVKTRLTTKRHQVRTDASNRFEKSRTPYSCPLAIHRFVELLLKLQPEVRVVGSVLDAYPERPKSVTVTSSYSYIRSRLDPAVSDEIIKSILDSLGFGISGSGDSFSAAVPYERATRDVTIQDDLVEEVGRIYGYERITELPPLIESVARPDLPIVAAENAIRDRLSGLGFSEAYLYSFADELLSERCGYPLQKAVRLQNPIDAERAIIRTTLVPGLIELGEHNGRYTDEMHLFELGRVYAHSEDLAAKDVSGKSSGVKERRLLGILSRSNRDEATAGAGALPPVKSGAQIYAMQSVLSRVVRLLTQKTVSFAPCQAGAKDLPAENLSVLRSWMHPVRAATVLVAGVPIGVLAEVRTDLGKDVLSRSVIAEIDLEQLLQLSQDSSAEAEGARKFKPLPKYPDSFFDMSVVIPTRELYSNLESKLRAAASSELVRRVEVFSLYEGKPLNEGEKSISLRFVFGSDERTLSTEEISSLQQRLMDGVKQSGYSLRS